MLPSPYPPLNAYATLASPQVCTTFVRNDAPVYSYNLAPTASQFTTANHSLPRVSSALKRSHQESSSPQVAAAADVAVARVALQQQPRFTVGAAPQKAAGGGATLICLRCTTGQHRPHAAWCKSLGNTTNLTPHTATATTPAAAVATAPFAAPRANTAARHRSLHCRRGATAPAFATAATAAATAAASIAAAAVTAVTTLAPALATAALATAAREIAGSGLPDVCSPDNTAGERAALSAGAAAVELAPVDASPAATGAARQTAVAPCLRCTKRQHRPHSVGCLNSIPRATAAAPPTTTVEHQPGCYAIDEAWISGLMDFDVDVPHLKKRNAPAPPMSAKRSRLDAPTGHRTATMPATQIPAPPIPRFARVRARTRMHAHKRRLGGPASPPSSAHSPRDGEVPCF